MKFSDLDKNLEEAPVGLGKRVGAKLQKKLAPGKQRRRRGATKDRVYTKAKEIKDDWKNWLTATYDDPNHEANMEDFLQFMQNNTGIGDIAAKVAKELMPKEFKAKKTEVGGDEVDGDKLELAKDQEDKKAKPEKVSKDEYEQGMAKIAADAEAEAKELGAEDDEVEEEVDMSASIYEAKLQRMLCELTDNEVDTLIFRTVQATARLGDGNLDNIGGEYTGPETEKGKSKPKEKEPSKYRKAMNKLSAKAFGDAEKANPLSSVGDDEESYSIGSGSSLSDLTSKEVGYVKDIIQTALDGKKLTDDQAKIAKSLLREL